MEYLYLLANDSFALRAVKYLNQMPQLPVKFITVIHLNNGWVFRVKMSSPLNSYLSKNLSAFLAEMGAPYQPPLRVRIALWSLEAGESPIIVRRRYQVTVIYHGSLNGNEIEAFRYQLIQELSVD
ncbi:hypothetical protein B7486_46485 [cyanobacterium TDX16]|nr:hypothetical protein B7486_46485 [cyanobacterium TDX16]